MWSQVWICQPDNMWTQIRLRLTINLKYLTFIIGDLQVAIEGLSADISGSAKFFHQKWKQRPLLVVHPLHKVAPILLDLWVGIFRDSNSIPSNERRLHKSVLSPILHRIVHGMILKLLGCHIYDIKCCSILKRFFFSNYILRNYVCRGNLSTLGGIYLLISGFGTTKMLSLLSHRHEISIWFGPLRYWR